MTSMEIIRWAASLSGIVAAIVVASNAGAKISGIGFIIFTVSSILWIAASLLGDEDPLLMQNAVLFGINVFGIYRYLWKKPSENR